MHQTLGTAGFVIAMVALIAALGGAAYAGGLTKAEKKQITKESKKFSKKFSKQFAKAGPAGPAGPGGPAGPIGPAGANGTQGLAGDEGPAGPTGDEGPAGPTGDEGPTGPTGDEGPTGPAGSPWTVDGTLPSEATETGVWNIQGFSKPSGAMQSAISFPIPLAAPLEDSGPTGEVHMVNTSGEEYDVVAEAFVDSLVCNGSVAAPSAESGHLCVYFSPMEGMGISVATIGPSILQSDLATVGADVSGANLQVIKNATEGNGRASGSFAVTG